MRELKREFLLEDLEPLIKSTGFDGCIPSSPADKNANRDRPTKRGWVPCGEPAAENAQLASPQDVAVDTSGNLYIADT